MNIFKKIALINKISKAIKAVKKALNGILKDEEFNKLTGGINKVLDGLSDIKSEIPEAKDAITIILDAVKN